MLGSTHQFWRVLSGSHGSILCHIYGSFNIEISTQVELQHYRTLTDSYGQGFGPASNIATEVYSDIRIWRVGDAD